ncbi:MAG TPA: hypothetical protein VNA25_20755 [Phycisphaerae bacterium]|nr:hypothetical protein [Phycisphaerae bacterium]
MNTRGKSRRDVSGIWALAAAAVLVLTAANCQAQSAPIDQSESKAYEFLAQQLDRSSDFYAYSDKGAPGNHFPPKGWMGDYGDIRMDEGCQINPHRGGSCISLTYTAARTRGKGWAGVYWHLHWGDGRAGYDLRPATKVTFWARGERGGELAEFKAGGIEGEFPDSLRPVRTTEPERIRLTREWRQYEIDLKGANLSHVVGGFCWVTNDTQNPSGCTIYLDDIRYEGARKLHLAQSYVPLPVPEDDALRNVAFTYDNALALLAFIARGNGEDQRRAGLIADSLVAAAQHDPDFNDGRLRNAYCADELFDVDGKARYQPGDAEAAGTSSGNVAWAMIALLAYHKIGGGAEYLATAKKLGEWIETNCRDSREAGGYTAGYAGYAPKQTKLAYKSTEHNIDLYVAFSLLADATGEQYWRERAAAAERFVASMWDTQAGHYWTGTLLDGETTNRDVIPMDVQCWALLALGRNKERERCLRWIEDNCRVQTDRFQGFAFQSVTGKPSADPARGIWAEGTAQACCAYRQVGEAAAAEQRIADLERIQKSAQNTDGQGLVAAIPDGLDTGFGWKYFTRLHLGATSWYVFAARGFNPYWQVSFSTGVRQ